MKIAVSTDGAFVSAHFGRCPEFTLFEMDNGRTASKEVLHNPGHEPGRIPQFLREKGVELIICGGMGMRAKMIFEELGIKTVVGVTGKVEETVSKFASGALEGGKSLCSPGAGKGYGLEKSACSRPDGKDC